MEKDTRPVRCFICRRKMYYAGHPKCEPEYTIYDDKTSGYVHASCIKALKLRKTKVTFWTRKISRRKIK